MIDVDWAGTAVNPYRILIPRTDIPLVQASPEIRELDINQFRKDLRTAEADVPGAPWQDTHNHVTQTTLSGFTYARLVEILPPYLVEFEDGQYSVRTTGANHNLLDVKVNNQVSLAVQNSAGLVNSSELQIMAYESGAVLVDPTNTTGKAQSGTTPIGTIGTRRRPVNNFPDALLIAEEIGITKFKIIGGSESTPVQLPSGDYQDKLFIGESVTSSFVEITSLAQVKNTRWRNLNIRGLFDGFTHIERCTTENITAVEGVIERSRIRGTITLTGIGQFSLLGCVDDLSGIGTPVIDWDNTDIEVIIRDFRGGLACRNRTNSKPLSVDGIVRLILESTFAGGGEILVRGIGPTVEVQNPSPAFTLSDQLVSRRYGSIR